MCELDRIWSDFEICRTQVAPEDVPIRTHADYMCEHCGGRRQYDVFDDLPVCIDCGRVDYEFISEEPEWRSGGDEGKADPSRVGAPVNTDHFSAAWGASTIMSVAKQASYQQKRLAMINLHNSMNHRDRALFHAYQELDRIGKEVLKLPASIMYIIKIKYKAFNEAVLTRGAVRNGIKANCVFQACREAGVSRTTQEIADAFGIPARDLSRTFDMYQEQLPETEVHITTAADVIPRFFNDITCVPESQRGRIKMKIVNVAKEMAECVELQGRTPKAVACAVIFVILKEAGLTPDKAELCKICGVSVPTLTKIEAIVRKLRNSDV
jgi:transcription initiation factor TFIIIB Brf1 subunit/transcription initiation factor TFIIB